MFFVCWLFLVIDKGTVVECVSTSLGLEIPSHLQGWTGSRLGIVEGHCGRVLSAALQYQ